jgi:NADPH:quinone reductase
MGRWLGCCRCYRTAAGDGSGLPAGTRVVGLVGGGAWAQFAAVPVSRLAPIPRQVPDVQAATLPTAGLTALRALEVGGLVLGKRVLVTGATGGVGRMAVQLASAGGAHVTALVRNAAASRELMGHLGATVVEQLSGDFDVIVEGVGGATFGLAIEHVAPRGVVVNLATQEGDETVSFRAKRFDRARGATIYTLNLPDELTSHASAASDLTRLCALAADGRLDGQVELECSWRQPGLAIDALLNRRIGGKAVLHID